MSRYVATYELYNINPTRLENLIHRIFEPARLDIRDYGSLRAACGPKGMVFWCHSLRSAMLSRKSKDGTIAGFVYDPHSGETRPAIRGGCNLAFRFWRRVRLAPGVTLNLSKSNASLSFGPTWCEIHHQPARQSRDSGPARNRAVLLRSMTESAPGAVGWRLRHLCRSATG